MASNLLYDEVLNPIFASVAFWVMTPCNLVDAALRFRRLCLPSVPSNWTQLLQSHLALTT
jgi:hypothetical protein